MTINELAKLPAMLTTAEAAKVFGVGQDHLWALARTGNAPVEPLRLGRLYRWPTVKLLALAGLDPAPALTRNEASTEDSEASPVPFATLDRQVRSEHG